MNIQETKDFIKNNNGKSGKMYNEKYVKNNHDETYQSIINYCNEKLFDIPFKEKVYHFVNDLKERIICKNPTCNNYVKFKNSTIGYYDYCSIQCISNDPKIKEIKEKKSLDKFGTKAPGMSEEVKKKMIKTNIKRYGGNSPLQNEKIKKKSKKTLMKNYGVDNPNKSLEIIERRVKSFSKNMKEKYLDIYKIYGVYNIDYKNKKIYLKCEKDHICVMDLDLFHNRIRTNTLLCTICNPIDIHISGQEIQLQNFVKENYNGEIKLNNREILNPYELDVYLPNLKLAIEFNGLYYHSEKCVENNYHRKKTELAEKNNIKLIQVYEDDWLFKQDIVKSRILNLLGKSEKIYARKCEIREINDNKLIREFLEKNHIQGYIGAKIKIGIFYKEELVSLMTFGNLRRSMGQKSIDGSYEMLRFCNKMNTAITGGASRMLKYFIEKYNPIEIISYADRSWSTGNSYFKLGFDLVEKTQPNYYYIINKERKYRFLFRKDKLIKDGFDPNKTEREIMLERKIYRIYDSGHLKFVYKQKKGAL